MDIDGSPIACPAHGSEALPQLIWPSTPTRGSLCFRDKSLSHGSSLYGFEHDPFPAPPPLKAFQEGTNVMTSFNASAILYAMTMAKSRGHGNLMLKMWFVVNICL